MSFQLTSERVKRNTRPSWASTAFIVEAMVLLVFLIASLALFMQLFSVSLERSEQSGKIAHAVAATSAVAERFAADPTAVRSTTVDGDLRITCNVSSAPHRRGTLYKATIAAYDNTANMMINGSPEDAIYTLSTAVYSNGTW